jgi:hypothetical protein
MAVSRARLARAAAAAAVLGFVVAVVLAEAGPADVEMVFLKNAVAKGAGACSLPLHLQILGLPCPVDLSMADAGVCHGAPVCLDGSPPVYHFSPGSGSGANNWVVHMEVRT